MNRVRVTRTAARDLDAIFDYWAKRATPDVARDLIYAITGRFKLLATAPRAGRSSPDIGKGILSFPVGKYLIYYRGARGTIHILHIFHGARDQASAFNVGQ